MNICYGTCVCHEQDINSATGTPNKGPWTFHCIFSEIRRIQGGALEIKLYITIKLLLLGI